MMGLYNFKPQFSPFILDGRKTHTIRAPRRHMDVVGANMHLYTGLRQKGARLLKIAECTCVQDIEISLRGNVMIDGYRLDADERDALARSDGFSDFDSMLSFWQGRLPFRGHIYHWR